MTDLSVIIPARNEEFLKQTIDNVLEQMRGDTEIIAIFDGYWPDPGIPVNEKVTIIHHENAIGQRAATNEGVNLSNAKYIMKLDAHCSVSEGFDVELQKNCEYDWTVIPRMYNLHAFDWVCPDCGKREYQGPRPIACCHRELKKEIIWKEKRNPASDFMLFDSNLKFGYWRKYKKRPEARGDICDQLCALGACWFMHRQRYLDIGGLDERHGSWGQVGVEIAMKSWRSGGSQKVNKNAWFAHMFRTKSDGFGFPYKHEKGAIKKARKHSRKLWEKNGWDKSVRSLEWLLDKFAPVPGWEKYVPNVDTKSKQVQTGHATGHSDSKKETIAKENSNLDKKQTRHTKGIVYYTDNQCEERIADTARKILNASVNGHRIVSVSQYPIDFGDNFVMPLKRSVLTMFEQMLKGIEEIDSDVIFFAEHDVLYNKSHFSFDPPDKNVYYYNDNMWKLDAKTGQALHHCEMKQVSGLVAHRELLLDHYTRRVDFVKENGFSNRLGYEPGKKKPRGLDNFKYEYFTSEVPIVDIKHGKNITPGRFKLDQYRCRKRIESSFDLRDEIPMWGETKGRFDEFLREQLDGVS